MVWNNKLLCPTLGVMCTLFEIDRPDTLGENVQKLINGLRCVTFLTIVTLKFMMAACQSIVLFAPRTQHENEMHQG